MHILRTNNCHENDRLIMFDNIVRRGLEAILNVELTTLRWTQACLPIRDGGLGVRTTVSLATSALLASAMSTLALQELILPSVANTIDSAVVASQERWKVITLEQPITGDLACKQRSWDQGRLSPLELWKPTPPPAEPPPPLFPPMFHVGSRWVGGGGGRRNDQIPNNYWGCKIWRRRSGKVEQFKYITAVLEHKPCSGWSCSSIQARPCLKFSIPRLSSTLPIAFALLISLI